VWKNCLQQQISCIGVLDVHTTILKSMSFSFSSTYGYFIWKCFSLEVAQLATLCRLQWYNTYEVYLY